MKKVKHLLTAVSACMLLVVITSCEDILDQSPISEVSDEIFWNTNQDAELGVASIYDAMQRTYRVKHFYWGEFRSDNYVESDQPSGETQAMITNSLTSDYEDALRWNELYTMIFRSNIAIEKIPQIPQFNENLLGEAYALRAYAYFDAYRVWGGVPLFKEAALTFDDSSFRPRSTAQEVLDLVLSDLAQADKLITTSTSPYRFSKASMLAFKAKIFMFLQRYQDANDALDQLIALNSYSLTKDRVSWRNLFLNDIAFPDQGQEGPELIMSLKYDFEEDGNRASGIYSIFFQGVPSVWISPLVQNKWLKRFPITEEEWMLKYPGVPAHIFTTDPTTGNEIPIYGDWRYYETVTEVGSPQDIRVSKYAKTNYSPAEDDTNIVLFRYADMLLLKAEAENQLDHPEIALELLNQVRVSRELPLVNSGTTLDVDINNKAALENFILDERQLELFAEGTRWWDLVRTGKAVEVLGPINGQTEGTIDWPIYFRHLIDNPLLEQNEPY